MSTSEVEITASQDKYASESIPDGVLAIIAKRDLEFGINRMWEIIAESSGLPWETMVFRDRVAAEKWVKRKVKEKYNTDLRLA